MITGLSLVAIGVIFFLSGVLPRRRFAFDTFSSVLGAFLIWLGAMTLLAWKTGQL